MTNKRPTAWLLIPLLMLVGSTAADPAEDAPKKTPENDEVKLDEKLPPGQESLWKLLKGCEARYAKVTGYTCTFSKRERIKDILQPAEVMAMKFRKPHAVHLLWKEGLLKNRQALYVEGKHDGKILVYTGNLPAFRKVFRIGIKSVEAKRENRHTIREAGMGYLVLSLRKQLEKARDKGALKAAYLGPQKVNGRKTWHIRRELENGGKREWNIDMQWVLPTRVATYDKDGKLLETYSYSDIKLNPGLKDEDFDPDELFF